MYSIIPWFLTNVYLWLKVHRLKCHLLSLVCHGFSYFIFPPPFLSLPFFKQTCITLCNNTITPREVIYCKKE